MWGEACRCAAPSLGWGGLYPALKPRCRVPTVGRGLSLRCSLHWGGEVATLPLTPAVVGSPRRNGSPLVAVAVFYAVGRRGTVLLLLLPSSAAAVIFTVVGATYRWLRARRRPSSSSVTPPSLLSLLFPPAGRRRRGASMSSLISMVLVGGQWPFAGRRGG